MFEDMARQIRLNDGAKFGGAFLLIPPDTPPEGWHCSLMLNQEQPGIFWASIQTISAIGVAEAEKAQRQMGYR
jgi:hypothetical protein